MRLEVIASVRQISMNQSNSNMVGIRPDKSQSEATIPRAATNVFYHSTRRRRGDAHLENCYSGHAKVDGGELYVSTNWRQLKSLHHSCPVKLRPLAQSGKSAESQST